MKVGLEKNEKFDRGMIAFIVFCLDSCKVNNGGCHKNADCSHDKTTFAVVCTCKTGYTNVGGKDRVICEGLRVWICIGESKS